MFVVALVFTGCMTRGIDIPIRMRLMAEALIAARPDRILWGSNWPHPILWQGAMPNDGDLLDQFMVWAGDEGTRKQILVDNPAALYGFD